MKNALSALAILCFFVAGPVTGQSCNKTGNGQNKTFKTMENQNETGVGKKEFTPVLACHLTSKEQAERYKELKSTLFSHITRVNELEDGYELIFEEKVEFSLQLIEFINFERICCPSFTFSLSFDPDQGPIHLQIKGSEGIKEMVETGLKEGGYIK